MACFPVLNPLEPEPQTSRSSAALPARPTARPVDIKSVTDRTVAAVIASAIEQRLEHENDPMLAVATWEQNLAKHDHTLATPELTSALLLVRNRWRFQQAIAENSYRDIPDAAVELVSAQLGFLPHLSAVDLLTSTFFESRIDAQSLSAGTPPLWRAAFSAHLLPGRTASAFSQACAEHPEALPAIGAALEAGALAALVNHKEELAYRFYELLELTAKTAHPSQPQLEQGRSTVAKILSDYFEKTREAPIVSAGKALVNRTGSGSTRETLAVVGLSVAAGCGRRAIMARGGDKRLTAAACAVGGAEGLLFAPVASAAYQLNKALPDILNAFEDTRRRYTAAQTLLSAAGLTLNLGIAGRGASAMLRNSPRILAYSAREAHQVLGARAAQLWGSDLANLSEAEARQILSLTYARLGQEYLREVGQALGTKGALAQAALSSAAIGYAGWQIETSNAPAAAKRQARSQLARQLGSAAIVLGGTAAASVLLHTSLGAYARPRNPNVPLAEQPVEAAVPKSAEQYFHTALTNSAGPAQQAAEMFRTNPGAFLRQSVEPLITLTGEQRPFLYGRLKGQPISPLELQQALIAGRLDHLPPFQPFAMRYTVPGGGSWTAQVHAKSDPLGFVYLQRAKPGAFADVFDPDVAIYSLKHDNSGEPALIRLLSPASATPGSEPLPGLLGEISTRFWNSYHSQASAEGAASVLSAGIRPLTRQDSAALASLSQQVFTDNPGMTANAAGFHRVLTAAEINNAAFNRPNLSFGYFSPDGQARGYLFVFEGTVSTPQGKRPAVFVRDLVSRSAAENSRGLDLTAIRLGEAFAKVYRENYSAAGRRLPIYFEARESTSYQILLHRLPTLERLLGQRFELQEIDAHTIGPDRLHHMFLLPK